MKYKTKTFFGRANQNNADEQFNEWAKDKDIEIISFKYQQSRFEDHSICILYREIEDNGGR